MMSIFRSESRQRVVDLSVARPLLANTLTGKSARLTAVKMLKRYRSTDRQDFRTRGVAWPKLLTSFATVLMLGLVGCGPQDATPKTSHFEHDHDIAPHWPADLADAATKMRERLVWIESGRVPEMHSHDHGDDHHDQQRDPTSEIFDLVSWVPEVAADTNLAESDWLPLYHASESVMTNLRAAKDELNRDDRSQVEALCQLIEEAVPKIPEQLASLEVTSP